MKVLISQKTGIKYLYKGKGEFHCKEGMIKEEKLNSNSNLLETNIGVKFIVFDALKTDLKEKIKRGPQIVIEKDLGYIAAKTGLGKNSIIIEAGGGSGGATIFFAEIAKKVITYEIKENHVEIIKKNLDLMDINNVSVNLGDLAQYIDEIKEHADILFLDMPDPKPVLEKELKPLKSGSYICCYLPSINQISELSNFIDEKASEKIYIEEVTETNIRHWKVKGRISRPEHQKQTDHTAFLVFLRKIN